MYLGINSIREKEHRQWTEVNIGSLVGLISVIGYSCYLYALHRGNSQYHLSDYQLELPGRHTCSHLAF
ncbi:hypothetical protein [Mesobacillus jeotgali]|uniref:hypothetical protein n=1 Tax=Mesobacillus jeotgali TaxID=129985 RepID=UPI00111643C2|nr:hypothetical protein [Mesobacillus jeotgali]